MTLFFMVMVNLLIIRVFSASFQLIVTAKLNTFLSTCNYIVYAVKASEEELDVAH